MLAGHAIAPQEERQFPNKFVQITAAATLTPYQTQVRCVMNGAAYTVTLPSVAEGAGRGFIYLSIDLQTAHPLTLQDGGDDPLWSNLVLNADDDWVLLYSTGRQWVVLAGKYTVAPVAGGASLTLTQKDHDGKTLLFSAASGTAFTLPSADGTGMKFRFVVSTTVTSNDHTIACVDTDEFAGELIAIDTDTSDALAAYPAVAADNFDTVTLDGSTQGGLQGDWIEVEDIAVGVWAIHGHIKQTGTPASPFSAAV